MSPLTRDPTPGGAGSDSGQAATKATKKNITSPPIWTAADYPAVPDYPGPEPLTPEERVRFDAALDALVEPDQEDPEKDLGFTDTDNAERLFLLHRDRLRFVHAFGSWLVWNGNRWQRDPRGVLVAELAKDISRDLYQQIAKLAETGAHVEDLKRLTRWAEQSAGKHRIDDAIWLTRGMQGILLNHEDLDADPWALCVINGWIDLRTGTFHPPDPAKLLTMQSPVKWDETAGCPLWEKSLAQWLPDPETRDYFQRLCGASIVGVVKDHILALIWGSGGNGKGTSIGAISKVLGDYFVVPHKSLLVQSRHEQHATVKATLFRIRVAVAAETESRIALNEAQVKELTGGDRMTARRLYENEWGFWPSHTLWLQTNHLPEVAGRDHGIWRRIKVLPWLATFEGDAEDRDLGDKLAAESPGILRWLVDGALRWQQHGLKEPETVKRATAAYRKAEDHIDRWMTDAGLTIGEELTILGSELAESWKTWTETNFGKPHRFNETADALEAMGCRKDHQDYRDTNGKRRRRQLWKGVGLTLDTPGQASSPKPLHEAPIGRVTGTGVPRGDQTDFELDLEGDFQYLEALDDVEVGG